MALPQIVLTNQFGEVSVNKVVSQDLIALDNNVRIFSGATAPVDGTTGDNVAGPGSLYVARDTGNLYRQTSLITTPVWSLFESGDSVLAQALTGYVSGAGTVAAADTVLQAFNKLNGNQVLSKATADAALPSASFTAAAVTSKLCTGFAAGADSTVLATDTILEAIAKLQGQINAL